MPANTLTYDASVAARRLAPHVPVAYYGDIWQAEQVHWWHRGMLSTSRVLLRSRLVPAGRALDAGCGTGGFLRFLRDEGQFSRLAGVDIASAAIDLARRQVPEADLHVAPLHDLPFRDEVFDLVVANDVLQHVPEAVLESSLGELRRVLSRDGALLVRTNGSRRLRTERDDWRAYDMSTLRDLLEGTGFSVERETYANMALSAISASRGRVPHAPTEERHGIPTSPGAPASAVGRLALALEARWLGLGGSLPYGHTLFALAVRR